MNVLKLLLTALFLSGGAIEALAQGGAPAGRGARGGMVPLGEIRGVVRDASTEGPLSASTVSLWSSADSSLVTGTVTRADGRFHIEGLRPGRYYVKVSHLGYESKSQGGIALNPANATVELEPIRLAVSAVKMEGLTVTSERSEVVLTPDRNTYKVKDMPVVVGGNVTDVLRNVPALQVDIDGNLSLRGNSNVAVQINGRPSPMRGEQLTQFLAQLPANMIERVEVIPNPSAKFDPEGMAGIVNLVLRKDTELGLSGGVTLGAGTNGRYNASGNLGYQRGPLTLFGNYGFSMDERATEGFSFRENRYLDPLTYLEQETIGLSEPLSHSFNVTADYKLSERNTLSGSVLLSDRGGESSSTTEYRDLDVTRELIDLYERRNVDESDDFTMDYALSFRRVLEPRRHELSAELRYSRETDAEIERYTQLSLPLAEAGIGAVTARELDAVDELTRDASLQLDYTRPLGAATRLEAGYKGTLRLLGQELAASVFSGEAGEFVDDPVRSNSFDFDERVHAAYGVLSHRAGSFDLQAGLRAEQATTEFQLHNTGEAYDNDYVSLFPSGLIAYNLDDTQQLKASYSKRINRPRTRFLNPFASFSDPLNLFVGNPYLSPEYTHAFELGYQRSADWGTMQVTPFYRHTEDVIRRIKTLDESGVSTTTFENLASSDSWGTDLAGTWRWGPLSGFAGASAFRTTTDGSNLENDLSSEALSWSTRLSTTWKVNPRLDVQGFVMYRAPMAVEQGRISGMTMTNLSLRQRVLGEKGSVTLRVVDPFDWMEFSFRTEDARHLQESRRSWGARGVYLGFSYNFGQQPRMRPRRGQQQEPDEGPGDMGIQ